MPYNYSKLNGRISEICGTKGKFAKLMNLSERTISLKLNNKVMWKQDEIQKALKVLNLSVNDIKAYFFAF